MTNNKTAEELAKEINAEIAKGVFDDLPEEAFRFIVALPGEIFGIAAEQRAQQGCYTLDPRNMSSLARKTFDHLISLRPRLMDVVARKDGREYRFQADMLKYIQPPNGYMHGELDYTSYRHGGAFSGGTPDTVTTSSDCIETRLAQIASGDYRACGLSPEQIAADILLHMRVVGKLHDYQRGFADGVAKVVSYHRNQFQYYSRMNQHHYADWHLICANTIEAKNMGESQ